MNRRYVTHALVAVPTIALALAATAAAQTDIPQRQDARPTLQLSLDDAVRRAVDNNPDLAVVRLGTQVEDARVAESLAPYAPVFSTVLGRSSNVVPPSNFLLGERGVDTNDWFSSTGVRQRVPWGSGTWNLSWDTSRTTSNSPLSSFQPEVQSGFQVAFSQPLLKDRRIDAVRQQNTIAARNRESSELRLSESGVQVVAAVKQAYWTLKANLANVTVQQRSLDLAHDLVRENRARVQVGLMPQLDLIQAEAEVAQRRENLIRAVASADDAEDRLRRYIIDPADASFWRMRLEPTDEATAGGPLPDVDEVVNRALGERYDLARARIELSNAATNVEYFSNQKLPDVRFETSYRGAGLGGTQLLRTGSFPGVVTGTLGKGYGDVLGDVFGHNYPTWSAGLTVSYSLGRSYEEAALAKADVERRQAGHRIASLQLQVVEAIRQAARQVRSTSERVEAARAGAMLAEKRLETEQKRHEVGLSTTFLVTQAQRDFLQSQVNLLQATLDHQSARVSFEALQQAPALGSGEAVGQGGANIAPLPTAAPRGLFRQAGSAF